MSGIDYDMFIQPKDEIAFNKFKEFIEAMKSDNIEKMEKLDSEELLYDVDEDLFGSVESSINGNIINLKFDTGKLSMETDDLIDFFISLGAENIEVSVFHGSCGEYEFYNNSELFERYLDSKWNWLVNPLPDFTNEHIVLTGKFDTFSLEDFVDQIESYNGTVSDNINKNVTLVVIGSEPNQNIISQATELNIPILTQRDFEDKYKL